MHHPFVTGIAALFQQSLLLQHLERLGHGPLGQTQVLRNRLRGVGVAVALRQIVQGLKLDRPHARSMANSAHIGAHQVSQPLYQIVHQINFLRHGLIVACRYFIDNLSLATYIVSCRYFLGGHYEC